jgi:hypothetical protein
MANECLEFWKGPTAFDPLLWMSCLKNDEIQASCAAIMDCKPSQTKSFSKFHRTRHV